MSIVNENQRGSIISSAWFTILPFPDGTINQYDRQQTSGIYRGFVNEDETEEPVNPIGSIWSYVTENNTVTWSG